MMVVGYLQLVYLARIQPDELQAFLAKCRHLLDGRYVVRMCIAKGHIFLTLVGMRNANKPVTSLQWWHSPLPIHAVVGGIHTIANLTPMVSDFICVYVST